MPRVSVLMPVYNTREEYLRAAIESILSQDYPDFEFLILNDGSSDKNVERVIKSYDDPRIKYNANPHNTGISAARNRLISMAQGEYLAVMDHDDISLPERFSRQVSFLDSHPEVGVVSCWFKCWGKKKQVCFAAEHEQIEKLLINYCCLCHPASMIRKQILVNNQLGYEEEYSPAEDYRLWGRLIGKTRFANIREVLFIYRNHEENTTHLKKYEIRRAEERIHTWLRSEHPDLWAKLQEDLVETKRIELFGCLPIFTVVRRQNASCGKLFGLLPLYNCKVKLKPDF